MQRFDCHSRFRRSGRLGFSGYIGFKCFFVVFVAAFGLLFCQTVQAQIKYSPDDEEIENLAMSAVAFLEANEGGGSNREKILSALVVNEVYKRYHGRVPTEHPLVTAGVAVAATDGARSSSTYLPALCIIVLCDVDDDAYAEEIKSLLALLEQRQMANGSYNYSGKHGSGDISQGQYVGLAYFVAKHHGFQINADSASALLAWTVSAQNSGSWFYHTTNGQMASNLGGDEKDHTLSRHCSGLGTVYMLADILQLSGRVKAVSGQSGQKQGLPPSVSIYVPPKEDGAEVKEGPLVQFNNGALVQCKRNGNSWLKQQFTPHSDSWNNYYLYALERYAFFRELEDGNLREVPDWYDQGVDLLKSQRNADGSFPGDDLSLNPVISTCFATLFLVRSSEVLILPPNAGTLGGAIGFPDNERLSVADDGSVQMVETVKGIDDALRLLNEDTPDEVRAIIVDSMKESIGQFKNELSSDGQKNAFLTGLIKERDRFRRLLAVQILASEQDMDNVVPLIYALGDPWSPIRHEAHNGLRLISRKIDSIPIPAIATEEDFRQVKKVWTEWFLQIRPDAKLITDLRENADLRE